MGSGVVKIAPGQFKIFCCLLEGQSKEEFR